MKIKAYLRVAKGRSGRYKIAAGIKQSENPLSDSDGKHLPTVGFAVVLNVPDEVFRSAGTIIAEIDVPSDVPRVIASVETE